MSEITPFAFKSKSIRVFTDERGEPLFVGKDLCEALGYANDSDAMKRYCRGVVKRYPIPDALGRMQETRVLAEPDMLRLIVNSTLPSAQKFEAWVFEDVLPTIRKTGIYTAPRARAARQDPLLIQAAKKIPPLVRAYRCIGMDKNAAGIAANTIVTKETGINLMQLAGQPYLEAPSQDKYLNASALMARMSWRAMNNALYAVGLIANSPKGKERQ